MLDNIERIAYVSFNPNNYIEIHLKKQGRDEVFDAIEHFKTLDFVNEADVITGRGYAF